MKTVEARLILGDCAKQRNEEFLETYLRVINVFTQQFIESFCEDGRINWEKLVQFNSSKYSF